jgi:hypothetical protein
VLCGVNSEKILFKKRKEDTKKAMMYMVACERKEGGACEMRPR